MVPPASFHTISNNDTGNGIFNVVAVLLAQTVGGEATGGGYVTTPCVKVTDCSVKPHCVITLTL